MFGEGVVWGGGKPLWFVSLTSVSRVVSGTSSPISSVEPCPRCVLVALSLHPGSNLALRKAIFFSLSLICSLTVSVPLFRSVIPGVSLAASDSFRHACQLYADDLRRSHRFPS